MRYWTLGVLGVSLFAASVVLFNLKLLALLDVGTCASGNQPFEISQPCPEGTEANGLLLVASIFGLFIAAGVFLARGAPPGGRRRGFAWPLLAWGIFFGGTGAVALIHSLTSDAVGQGGELGGGIVGVTFLVMGLPVLLFVISGAVGNWRDRSESWSGSSGSIPQPITVPEPPVGPLSSSFDRAGEQGAERFSDDTISKLERLQRLRDAGALSPGEFEAEKARVLSGG